MPSRVPEALAALEPLARNWRWALHAETRALFEALQPARAAALKGNALRLLRERKPDRRLDTNVEFFTALLLHGLGLSTDFFTPTFAVGRVAGWAAHCLEQLREGKLIRPQSEYVGPIGRRYA